MSEQASKPKVNSGVKGAVGHLFVLDASGGRVISMNPEGSDRRVILNDCTIPDGIVVGGSVRVEAKLSAELLNLRTGATVWAGEATDTKKVKARNLNSVVAAMSQAVQTNINRLVAGMKEQLSESEAASKGSH